MNRRLFFQTGALALAAAAVGATQRSLVLRRVDIERNGQVLRNRAFRELRKDDVAVILGSRKDDDGAGMRFKVMSDLKIMPDDSRGSASCEIMVA
jgi:hypothetical protein